jgi:uncharacterized damage-inducible protein DinB
MIQKEILLSQLSACHDDNHWFVAMSGVLKGLSAKQAAAPAAGSGAHSIWEILYHVTYWNDRWLQRYNGKESPEPRDNDETFLPGIAEQDEPQWRALVERYSSVMKAWRTIIREADEAALAAPAQKGPEASWHSVLSDMILHTAHHGGQIVTLRKLQGSWDTAQGVT